MKTFLLRTAFVVAVIALAVTIGVLAPARPALAGALALGILLMGASSVDRALVPLLSVPLLLITARLGTGDTDVSLSDVVLAVVTVPALLLSRPVSAPMRKLLWLVGFYLFASLFTVVADPYLANVIEWPHIALLTGGALFVGWTIGRERHGATALTLLVLTACLLSLLTIIEGVRHLSEGSLEPVYLTWPYSMHKNFIGSTLALAAMVVYVRPTWLGWSKPAGLAAFTWLLLGLGFSQSRQAIIALAVVLVILVLRATTERRRSKAILLAVIPVLVFVLTLVQGQAEDGNEFNPVRQRVTWFADAIDVWQQSPIVGVGHRWWYLDDYDVRFQPPNAILEVLTTSGVIGLAAFLALMIGSLLVLRRVRPEYGNLAFSAILFLFVKGQFDLFWTAVNVSVPFMIVGICLGALAHREEDPTLASQDPTDEAPIECAAALP